MINWISELSTFYFALLCCSTPFIAVFIIGLSECVLNLWREHQQDKFSKKYSEYK